MDNDFVCAIKNIINGVMNFKHRKINAKKVWHCKCKDYNKCMDHNKCMDLLHNEYMDKHLPSDPMIFLVPPSPPNLSDFTPDLKQYEHDSDYEKKRTIKLLFAVEYEKQCKLNELFKTKTLPDF